MLMQAEHASGKSRHLGVGIFCVILMLIFVCLKNNSVVKVNNKVTKSIRTYIVLFPEIGVWLRINYRIN